MQIDKTSEFGWVQKNAKIDSKKKELLDKYVLGNRVADLGCATGIYASSLEKKGKWVIGIDKNITLLTYAKNIIRLKASVTKLPLKKKSVDTTLAFDVLEHLNESAINEIKRITKKRIIITVPRTTDEILSKNWLVFGHHIDTSHKRTYTTKSADKLLKRFKLKKVKIILTHPISTESLLIDILEGSLTSRKLLRKLIFILAKPKKFYSNLAIIADVK